MTVATIDPRILLVIGLLLIIAGLTAAFVLFARAIKRDIDRRFRQLAQRLDREAMTIVRDVLDDD